MNAESANSQRQQLIKNVLANATANGHLVVLAAAMDRLVRVHDVETDLPVYLPLRAVRWHHVAAD